MIATRILKQTINMILPVVLFRLLYGTLGVPAALLCALAVSVTMNLRYRRVNGRWSNSLIIGFAGLLFSLLGSVATGDDRAMFYPGIVKNLLYVMIISVFTWKKKSYVYFFLEDMELTHLREIDEKRFVSNNLVWIATFALRLLMRTVSLFAVDLSFDTVYWISFLAGDPVTVPAFIITYFDFDRRIKAYYKEKRSA